MTLKALFTVLVSSAVLAALSSLPHASAAQQEGVWSGIYTEQQAQRGKRVHAAVCSQCHGLKLDGANQPDMPQAPAIAGRTLIQKWAGQSVTALFEFTKATMPPTNPGSLTDQQYIDSIAYMLEMSNMPPGDRELPAVSSQRSPIIIGPGPQR